MASGSCPGLDSARRNRPCRVLVLVLKIAFQVRVAGGMLGACHCGQPKKSVIGRMPCGPPGALRASRTVRVVARLISTVVPFWRASLWCGVGRPTWAMVRFIGGG